jgi:tRNA-dihydrouridine synthase 2
LYQQSIKTMAVLEKTTANDAEHTSAADPVDPPSCNEASISEIAQLLYRGAALAPMVRASTTPLRALALEYGADFVYTEELVDRAITETIRVENKAMQTIDYVKDPSTLSKKTQRKLQAQNNRPCLILRIDPKIETGKLVCQLGSGEPELALEAAKHVYKDVSAIDINMGCPRKFSVSGGMGSALLGDPDRAARIIRTLKGEIPRPISCKIRLLENTQKTVDFVETMIRAGVNACAIHARRVGHDGTVAADWKTLEEVLGLLQPKYPSFNFLLNGDFYDRKERSELLERTKASGVLLGRPALYNTSIFLPESHPLIDKTTIVQEYLKKSIRYDIHYKNTKYVICEMMGHRRTPADRVPYLPINFPGGQTIAKTCNCHDLERMCQVWNINYSDALENAKMMYSEQGNMSLGTTVVPSTTTMAAGEHRYEDSYFLKRQMDQVLTKEGDNMEKVQAIFFSGTDRDEEPCLKRAKVGDAV